MFALVEFVSCSKMFNIERNLAEVTAIQRELGIFVEEDDEEREREVSYFACSGVYALPRYMPCMVFSTPNLVAVTVEGVLGTVVLLIFVPNNIIFVCNREVSEFVRHKSQLPA